MTEVRVPQARRLSSVSSRVASIVNVASVSSASSALRFSSMKKIDRNRLKSLSDREQKRFVDERPKSKALFERARKSLLGGVPMNWMAKWAGAFPPFVREAQGAYFYDVDGHRYVDLCLGDTGAMTGHSPFATVKAIGWCPNLKSTGMTDGIKDAA